MADVPEHGEYFHPDDDEHRLFVEIKLAIIIKILTSYKLSSFQLISMFFFAMKKIVPRNKISQQVFTTQITCKFSRDKNCWDFGFLKRPIEHTF